jgi:hypothetical protein
MMCIKSGFRGFKLIIFVFIFNRTVDTAKAAHEKNIVADGEKVDKFIEPERMLKGVMRVGLLAKGLLLKVSFVLLKTLFIYDCILRVMIAYN